MQSVYVLVGEPEVEQLVEQRRGFGAREPQLVGVDLYELAAGAEPGNLKRRLGPRRDRDAHVVREVVHQPTDASVDRVPLQQVVVVEREHQRLLDLRQLVYQHRQHLADQVDARCS